MITYAVVGRDEALTLEVALGQALEAAGSGDRVWFVDSASVDGSAEIARRLGVEVLRAPAGKGRAVAAAIESCGGGPLCLLDADIEESSCNIAATLMDGWRATEVDMLVGSFYWPEKGSFSLGTPSIHDPLVHALFPEYAHLMPVKPLSGFRVLDTSFPLGRLPAGYGLEAHLNIHVPVVGGRVESVDIGIYHGPVRHNPSAYPEIGGAILDVAQAQGRIAPDERAQWDAWLQPILDVLVVRPPAGGDARKDYRRRLLALSERPFPNAASGP